MLRSISIALGLGVAPDPDPDPDLETTEVERATQRADEAQAAAETANAESAAVMRALLRALAAEEAEKAAQTQLVEATKQELEAAQAELARLKSAAVAPAPTDASVEACPVNTVDPPLMEQWCLRRGCIQEKKSELGTSIYRTPPNSQGVECVYTRGLEWLGPRP